jgi:hypothetical protein
MIYFLLQLFTCGRSNPALHVRKENPALSRAEGVIQLFTCGRSNPALHVRKE